MPTVPLNFDVQNGNYEDFIDDLRRQLAVDSENPSMGPYHPTLLPKQEQEQPHRWIHINLSVQDKDQEPKTITLAVRGDNVYLVGFKRVSITSASGGGGGGGGAQGVKNHENTWYESGMPSDYHFLHNSTFLGYHFRYDELISPEEWIEGGVGKTSAEEAVRKLYEFNGTGARCNGIKKYLAKLIVMFCECARMHPHNKKVKTDWPLCQKTRITDDLRECMLKWSKMSRAMMGWLHYPINIIVPDIVINDHTMARSVVHLILNSPLGGAGKEVGPDCYAKVGPPPPPGDSNGQTQWNGKSGMGGGHTQTDVKGKDRRGGGGGIQHQRNVEHATHVNKRPNSDDATHEKTSQKMDGSDSYNQTPMDGGDTSSTHGKKRPNSDDPIHGEKRQKTEDSDSDDQILEGGGGGVQTGWSGSAYGGRSLVEVFALHATARIPFVGSIVVLDGRSGQTIYSNEQNEDAPIKYINQGDLELTGPYRGISASGRVALKIKGTAQADVPIWDPYAEAGHHYQYNKLLTKEITEGLKLTYAVLSSAVEARVQVHVFLFGDTTDTTAVYGQITARSKLAGGDKEKGTVVLFNSQTKLIPSPAGGTIPLLRSVVVWDMDSPLEINVEEICFENVHLATPPILFRDLKFSFDDKADKVLIYPLPSIGYVRVTVDDTREYRDEPGNSLPRSLMNKMRPDMSRVTELMDIHPGNLCFTFEPSKPMHCLIHLTNKSVGQRVAFRCQAGQESELFFHDLADLFGILPPDSTSTFLVRLKSRQQLPLKKDVLHLTLESCVAGEEEEEEKDVGTIFGRPNQQIEEVKLKVTVHEDEVDTIFNKAGEGTKELTLNAPFIDPTLLGWVSETKMVLPMTAPSIDQGDLLDVHVLYQLISLDKNDKMICCILHLTSRTKHHIAFKCVPSNSQSCLYSLDHTKGILTSGSTTNFVLLTQKMRCLPDNLDALSIVLKTRVSEKEMDSNEDTSSQDPGHGIPLMTIYDNKPTPPRIEIMTLMEKGCEIVSMDVHPEKPWILTSHVNGNVSIWNYQTQEKEAESRVSDVKGTDSYGLTHWICSAKFIAPKEWIVASDGNGKIHVLDCNTMTEIKKFQAHKRGEWVESLAVHPSQPFVLSASMDNEIRLWNYDKDWERLWTHRRGHDDYVKHVTFSPDGNTFASASQDWTVKIWSTQPNADRPKLIATLDCGEDTQQHAAYYSVGGRQYMITGSLEGSARIWDLQNLSTVGPIELPGPESEVYGCNVGVINCVPENCNPILITTSGDTGISFLDAATHKPRYDMVCFDLGPAQGFAPIEVQGKRSLAIILSGGIAIMEMNEDPVKPPAALEHTREGISA